LMIDCVSLHGGEAGYLTWREVAAQTLRADRRRRVKPLAARVATQDAKPPFPACRPKEGIQRRQGRQRAAF